MLITLKDYKSSLSTLIEIDIEKEYVSYTNHDKNNKMYGIDAGYNFITECDKKDLARETTKVIVKYCSAGKYKLRYYSKGQPTKQFEQRWNFRYLSITDEASMYIQLFKDYTDEKWKLLFDITGMITGGAKYYSNEKIVEIENNIDQSYPYFFTFKSDKKELQQIIDRLSRKAA